MIYRKYSFLFSLGLLFSTIGCSGEKSSIKDVDLGTITDSVYSNKFFGLSLTVPEGWHIQDQETRDQLMDVGKDMLSNSGSSELKAAADVYDQSSLNLLTAFKHELGSPVPFNPSVICMAENLTMAPSIQRGKDYHLQTKRLLQQSQLNVSFSEQEESVSLGGKEFDQMNATMAMMGLSITQEYYARVDQGFALVFILSYASEEERTVLEGILDSVTFSQ